MTLAHDANTRWPAAGTDVTTGDRTFTHTPSGTPAGVVFVLCSDGLVAACTGVLYGGVAMQLKTTGINSNEDGLVEVYAFPDRTVPPSGAQTVTVQGATGALKFGTLSTVTATSGVTEANTSNHKDESVGTNPSINFTTTKTTITYGGYEHGDANVLTVPISGCTNQHSNDYGAKVAGTLRRTSPDASGTVTLGYTFATSEDYTMAGVAIAEAAASVDLTPATLNLAAVALTATPGMVTVNLVPAVLNLTAVALDPQAVEMQTVNLTPATLNLAAVALTATPGMVTAQLVPAVLNLAAVTLTATPGVVTVALTPARLDLAAVSLDPIVTAGVVNLVSATLSLAAAPLVPTPGSVTVDLVPAALLLSAVPLTATPGPALVNLTPATLLLSAVALAPIGVEVVTPIQIAFREPKARLIWTEAPSVVHYSEPSPIIYQEKPHDE